MPLFGFKAKLTGRKCKAIGYDTMPLFGFKAKPCFEESCIAAVRELLHSRRLPPAHSRRECRSCSLRPICLPRHPAAGEYNDNSFGTALREE